MTKRINISDLLPDTNYALRVRVKNGDSISDWSPVVNFATITDDVNPSVPTDVTWVASGDSFHGEWTAVTTNTNGDIIPITRYEIELVGNSVTKILSTAAVSGDKGTYDLSFEENRVFFSTPQHTVTMRVRAVDNKELKSDWSGVISATNPAPGPVTGLTATGGTGSIDVSWTPPADDDIVHYNAYLGAVKIWSGAATRFTFNTVIYTSQTITVKAVDKFLRESTGVNASATATSPFIVDTTAPSVPTALAATVTNNANGIGARAVVTWTGGAETDRMGYNLAWKKNADSTWTTVTFEKDATSGQVDLPSAYTAYDFRIRAFDSSANYSAWSATLAKAAVANTAPANVTGLTATPGRDSIVYSWTAVADADLKNYEVTFSTSSTFASGNITYLTGTATTLTVSGLSPSTNYYARVRAVDTGGLTSAAWSSTNTTTTLAYGTNSSDGSAPASSPTPTVTSGIGNLFINWTAVTNNDPVTYEVHISTSTGFTPSAGTKALETASTFAVLEKDGAGSILAYGTTYYVKLIAKDRDGSAAAGTQGSGAIAKVVAADSSLVANDVGAYSISQISSRATDLVTNGTGLLQNNYNFSTNFDVNLTDAPVGITASFYDKTTASHAALIDELIPFDPAKRYKFTTQIRQTVAGATTRAYGMLVPYDAWGNVIDPVQSYFWGATTTTLAAPLNNGDTTITLTSATNWYGTTGRNAGGNAYNRSIIFWNWVDPNGKVWPPQTYSRNYWKTDAWADGGITGNVITLNTPWTGGSFPAGHPVSNGSAGGTYMYAPAFVNLVVPETWTTYSDTFSAGIRPINDTFNVLNSFTWATGMPPGTAQVKVGWLLNRTPTPSNPIVGRHAIAGISFSDAQAAQETANTALTSANGKNKITHSLSTPGSTANTAGDTWFQYNGSNQVIAQWRGTGGTSWVQETVENALIANLDAAKITAGFIDVARLQANSITAAKLAVGTITAASAVIADAAITTAKIADLNVTTAKIALLAVNTAQIADAAIATAKIGDAQITTAKIADANITTAKIGDAQITTAKINDLAVTNAKIADLSVTKLTAGTVGGGFGITMAAGSNILLNGGYIKSNTYTGTTQATNPSGAGFYLGNDGIRVDQGIISASALVAGTISGTNTITLSGANAKIVGTGFELSGSGLTVTSGTIAAAAVTITSTFANNIGATMTTIDGGIIKTGSIQSQSNTGIGGTPLWSIPLNGSATFQNLLVRGQTVIGSSGDGNASTIQSHNYSPGSTGWMLDAAGTAELRQVAVGSLSGSAVENGTLSAEAISGGTITSGISLAGMFETSTSPVSFNVTITSGSPTITTTDGVFYSDDIGVTISGVGIPAGATIIARNSSTSVTINGNASASGTISATVYRGRKVRISGADGVTLYNASGTAIVELPTDPSRSARFSGSLFATDVHVEDRFRLYGINNSLGSGAVLQLNPGTYTPPAPALNYDWNTGHLYNSGSLYNPSTDSWVNSPTGFKYDPVNDRYYYTLNFFGTSVHRFVKNVSAPTSYDFEGSFSGNSVFVNGANDIAFGGWAQDATHFHFLTYHIAGIVGSRWKRQSITRAGVNRVGGPIGGDSIGSTHAWFGETSDGTVIGNPTIGMYGGNLFTAKINNSGQMVVYKHSGINTSTISYKLATPPGLSGNLASMEVGQFDYGTGNTYIAITWVSASGSSVVFVFRDTGSSIVQESFPWVIPFNKQPIGVAYRGSSTNDVSGFFQTLVLDGHVYDHTKFANADSTATLTSRLAYRYDGTVGGYPTSGIGSVGPDATVSTLTARRSKVILSLPFGVTIPNTGLNSPNSITFYAGTSTVYKFPETAAGVTSLSISELRTSNASGTAGALSSGVPSQITANNGFSITGEGDITTRHITTTGTGWVNLTLNTNYQAFGAGFQTPQYKRVGNTVYLRGLVGRNTSTAAAGSTIATLPSGTRPTGGNEIFEQILTGVRVRIDVDSGGAIKHVDVGLGVGGYLSLSGISFETS